MTCTTLFIEDFSAGIGAYTNLAGDSNWNVVSDTYGNAMKYPNGGSSSGAIIQRSISAAGCNSFDLKIKVGTYGAGGSGYAWALDSSANGPIIVPVPGSSVDPMQRFGINLGSGLVYFPITVLPGDWIQLSIRFQPTAGASYATLLDLSGGGGTTTLYFAGIPNPVDVAAIRFVQGGVAAGTGTGVEYSDFEFLNCPPTGPAVVNYNASLAESANAVDSSNLGFFPHVVEAPVLQDLQNAAKTVAAPSSMFAMRDGIIYQMFYNAGNWELWRYQHTISVTKKAYVEVLSGVGVLLPELLPPTTQLMYLSDPHQVQFVDIYGNVSWTTGEDSKRMVYTAAPRIVTVALDLSAAEMTNFYNWYEGPCQVGSQWFSAQLANFGPGLLWFKCRFYTPYIATPDANGTRWLVKFNLYVLGEGSQSDPGSTTFASARRVQLEGNVLPSVLQQFSSDRVVQLESINYAFSSDRSALLEGTVVATVTHPPPAPPAPPTPPPPPPPPGPAPAPAPGRPTSPGVDHNQE